MIINEYSLPEVSKFSCPAIYQKKTGKQAKGASKNYFNLLFSFLLILLMVASAFYTQKVLKDIQEKKEQLLKLKKVYYSTLMTNEKIHVMIDEIQNDQYQGKQLIKIMEEQKFKDLAEKIKKNYALSQNREKKSFFGYFLLLGLMVLVVIRLIYLEIFQKKKYDLVQN